MFDCKDEIRILKIIGVLPLLGIWPLYVIAVGVFQIELTIKPFKMKKLIYTLLASVFMTALSVGEFIIYAKITNYFPEVRAEFPAIGLSIIWLTCFVILLGVVFKNNEQ
jgi:hypothetical protein